MERFLKASSENNLKNNKNLSPPRNISFEDDLNSEQLKVVNNLKGPIIVIAGAGSGKTRVITYCVAKLIKKGIKPSEIMLVTFTNKASNEMLERVEKLLGYKLDGLWGGTFHSLANKFIRKYTKKAGLQPNYRIMDQTDSINLMNLTIKELFPNYQLMDIPSSRECFQILSYSLNCNKKVKEILKQKYNPIYSDELVSNLNQIFHGYSNKKITRNLVDFNDLLVLWNRLLDEKELAEKIARKIKYVLVDEYQDTNFIQAKIIFKISKLNHNIMVVGDDAQSIYAFRGANIKNLLDFGKNFNNIKKYQITINYRSTPEILNLANDSLKNNKNQFQKNMKSIKNGKKKPKIVYLENEDLQNEYIINEIKKYVKRKIPLNEIAILYRSNFHSLKLQRALEYNNIPFEIRSGLSFFEQAHIKDFMAI